MATVLILDILLLRREKRRVLRKQRVLRDKTNPQEYLNDGDPIPGYRFLQYFIIQLIYTVKQVHGSQWWIQIRVYMRKLDISYSLGPKSWVLLKLFRIFVAKGEGEQRALALSPALDQKMLKLKEFL